jgi:hypothetical protein
MFLMVFDCVRLSFLFWQRILYAICNFSRACFAVFTADLCLHPCGPKINIDAMCHAECAVLAVVLTYWVFDMLNRHINF